MAETTGTLGAKLIAIGNSRGIRIPKVLREKYGWSESIMLEEIEEGLPLRRDASGKLSWRETCKAMAAVRPVVVVSQNEMNRFLGPVVVCPLTTSLHPGWRSRIQIQCAGKPAEIAVDQIRTLSKQRLRNNIDRLAPATASRQSTGWAPARRRRELRRRPATPARRTHHRQAFTLSESSPLGGEQGREVGVDHTAQLNSQRHQVAVDRIGLALQATQSLLDRLKFLSRHFVKCTPAGSG